MLFTVRPPRQEAGVSQGFLLRWNHWRSHNCQSCRRPHLALKVPRKLTTTEDSDRPTVSRSKIRFVPCIPWFQQPTELMLLAWVPKRAMGFPTRSCAEPIRSLDSERCEPFQVP